jgi:purine-binding chemotaxis protein CheW
MSVKLTIFTLEEQRYALRLAVVDRVVHAVQISPLPQAPEIVLGIINMQGKIIPIINMRRRFLLPEREIALTNRLIIARTAQRSVGLVVDTVADVMEYPEQNITETESILPGLEYVEGVMKLEDGMVYIHDLDLFLSMEEETSLAQAMETS